MVPSGSTLRDCLMVTLPVANSTASHGNPVASPGRTPQCNITAISAYMRSSLAAFNRARASSDVSDLRAIGLVAVLGIRASFATLRMTSSLRSASVNTSAKARRTFTSDDRPSGPRLPPRSALLGWLAVGKPLQFRRDILDLQFSQSPAPNAVELAQRPTVVVGSARRLLRPDILQPPVNVRSKTSVVAERLAVFELMTQFIKLGRYLPLGIARDTTPIPIRLSYLAAPASRTRFFVNGTLSVPKTSCACHRSSPFSGGTSGGTLERPLIPTDYPPTISSQVGALLWVTVGSVILLCKQGVVGSSPIISTRENCVFALGATS